MKEKTGLNSIIAQVAILFMIGTFVIGLFTHYTQHMIVDINVKKHTEDVAKQVAREVKEAIREYSTYKWLLNYWYEHWDELDIEYDADFQKGTLTEDKCILLESHCPGLFIKYASTEEIEALSEEDQKLYAEIIYSWLTTRLNQIKRTHETDYLFCVSTDNTYKKQFFLLSAADPGAVRGTKYEEVYTLGTTVTVSGSQKEAMYSAYKDYNHLTDAGNYVDYYSYIENVNNRIILIGMTFNLESIGNHIHSEANRSTFYSVIYQICLSILCLILIMKVVLRPLKKVQENIRLYKDTKNSKDVVKNLKEINSKNEIGMLATDIINLTEEIDDYTEKIALITSEKDRIEIELKLASRIQESILPDDFPAFPDRKEFDIYASMNPAKEVGGDFYDFYMIDDDHLYIIIADVSGKGVPAALFMMMTKIILFENAKKEETPAEILAETNATISSHNREEMFVTVWVGILEISTGILTAANAGHEYPILMQDGGQFEIIRDEHGFVVGGMDNIKYKNYEIKLNPGAKLFVYTDGLTEASNAEEEMFGENRVVEALNIDTSRSPEQILKDVAADVDEFVKDAKQYDDLTMLCLEYRGPQK